MAKRPCTSQDIISAIKAMEKGDFSVVAKLWEEVETVSGELTMEELEIVMALGEDPKDIH